MDYNAAANQVISAIVRPPAEDSAYENTRRQQEEALRVQEQQRQAAEAVQRTSQRR